MSRRVAFLLISLALLCGCSKPSLHSPSVLTAESGFIDVAARSGIDFTHVNGASGQFYYPETNGSGCAFFDADGDGFVDVFLVNAAPLPGYKTAGKVTSRLYLNNGNGTFRDATANSGLEAEFYGTGCCAGDYDNDGRPDLYVSNALGPGHLYHNLGGGKFEDVTKTASVGDEGHWGTACAWLDYDRDGKLDLFVGNYVRYRLGSDTPCLFSEGYKSYCGPRWFSADHPSLFRNIGNGKFRDVSAETGLTELRQKALGVSILDFNGDMWPDIFVTNDVWEQHLLENVERDGKRKFKEVGVEQGIALTESGHTLAGMGVDTVDLMGDGRLWVATANFSTEGVAIFRQDRPGGTFRDASQMVGTKQPSLNLLGFGLAWVDSDNSGTPQIVVANGHVHPEVSKHQPQFNYAEPKLMLEWDGQGRFRDVSAQAGSGMTAATVGRGLAAGDFDNDGRVDLLVNNVGGAAQLLHNTRSNTNHWIGLQLEGRKSNRSGYGASVTVEAGGKRWNQLSGRAGSYCSQRDPRLHFGLGAAASVGKITIRWPSGATDTVVPKEVDRYFRIVEGTGQAVPSTPVKH